MHLPRKFLMLALLSWMTLTRLTGQEVESPAVQVVLRQLAAFNQHDGEALARGVAEDFVWYAVTSEATSVEAKGREAFREGMISYFKSFPDVSSRVDGVVAAGSFVSFRETVTWTGKNGRRRQSSIGVYQVRDGLIARVWYYPAAR